MSRVTPAPPQPYCRRSLLRRGLGRSGYPFLHLGRAAVLAHLVEPHRVDTRILILVVDLVAALLDAQRDGRLGGSIRRARGAPLDRRQRITQRADASREVARR